MNFNKRFEQPLINRLENIINVILKGITHSDYKVIKEKFTPLFKIMLLIYMLLIMKIILFYQGYIIKNNDKSNKRVSVASIQDN